MVRNLKPHNPGEPIVLTASVFTVFLIAVPILQIKQLEGGRIYCGSQFEGSEHCHRANLAGV